VTETIAGLGAAAGAPVAPSAALRERVLESVRQRQSRSAATRRALVVCDMINDHLTPGRPLEVPRARAIVQALARRIGEWRATGAPVVYLLDRHEPGDPELEQWGMHAVEGTEGAHVWPDLAPAASDRIVTKPSYSGFYGTELEKVLEELAVDTIVLTGCATEVQLMATASDALHRGFAVEVPRDSQAGTSEAGEMVTLGVLAALVPYAPSRRARLSRIAARTL
jgi:nicotinamidase-related amidase